MIGVPDVFAKPVTISLREGSETCVRFVDVCSFMQRLVQQMSTCIGNRKEWAEQESQAKLRFGAAMKQIQRQLSPSDFRELKLRVKVNERTLRATMQRADAFTKDGHPDFELIRAAVVRLKFRIGKDKLILYPEIFQTPELSITSYWLDVLCGMRRLPQRGIRHARAGSEERHARAALGVSNNMPIGVIVGDTEQSPFNQSEPEHVGGDVHDGGGFDAAPGSPDEWMEDADGIGDEDRDEDGDGSDAEVEEDGGEDEPDADPVPAFNPKTASFEELKRRAIPEIPVGASAVGKSEVVAVVPIRSIGRAARDVSGQMDFSAMFAEIESRNVKEMTLIRAAKAGELADDIRDELLAAERQYTATIDALTTRASGRGNGGAA